jgi:uncharacterized protein (TIGR02145 family)
MEILDTKAYNEKLNIQPIPKDRIAQRLQSPTLPSDWKHTLKTGDIVVMCNSQFGGDIDEASFYFYVSQESLEKYNYNKIFDISTLYDYDISEGIIVRKNYHGNTPKFTYDCISAYGDKYPQRELLRSVTFVHKIFRNDLLKEPLGEDLFCASLVAIQNYVRKCRTVFSYKPKDINEKLKIQPISSERLDKMKTKTVQIGNLIWTAENATTLVTHSGSPLVKGTDYFEEDGEIYYTFNAAVSVVPNGWRIPTKDDINKSLGICNGEIIDLISKDYGGNDKYGFGLKLLGIHTPNKIIGKDMYTNLIFEAYSPHANDPQKMDSVKSVKIVGKELKPEHGGVWVEKLSIRYGMSLRFVRNI